MCRGVTVTVVIQTTKSPDDFSFIVIVEMPLTFLAFVLAESNREAPLDRTGKKKSN